MVGIYSVHISGFKDYDVEYEYRIYSDEKLRRNFKDKYLFQKASI
jgi:hypothetical protein